MMKGFCLIAALTAATVLHKSLTFGRLGASSVCALLIAIFITAGCRNDTESKLVGIYEHPALPGQTFEFHADHTFMNTTGAGDMDCVIKHPGTWEVEGDSLFIANDTQNTAYEFGDGVTEENKTLAKGLFERMAESLPKESAFKIIGVDEKKLSLERYGQITTYVRKDSTDR